MCLLMIIGSMKGISISKKEIEGFVHCRNGFTNSVVKIVAMLKWMNFCGNHVRSAIVATK